MKSLKLLIVGIAVLVIQLSSQAEGFYFGVGLGGGDIDIDRDLFPSLTTENTESNTALVLDILGGHEFSNGVFVDLGLESYNGGDILGLGDQVDFSTKRIGIGYIIPSESRFKFYGKTGINFWDLTVTEGALFNPGPEEAAEKSGENAFFQIGAEYHFDDSYRLGLGFDFSNNDIVETTGVKLTFKWLFK